jgi:hypothetical protein
MIVRLLMCERWLGLTISSSEAELLGERDVDTATVRSAGRGASCCRYRYQAGERSGRLPHAHSILRACWVKHHMLQPIDQALGICIHSVANEAPHCHRLSASLVAQVLEHWPQCATNQQILRRPFQWLQELRF